jgi:hypothetical protein
MIYRVSDPETGEESVMVIDRANHLCVIIKLSLGHVTSLVAIARAMGVMSVLAITDTGTQGVALLDEGWKTVDLTVLEYKLRG